jgi:hypothetical protein
MKTGDIKVIDERFVAPSPAASWDEYLVLERLGDGKFDLAIRQYEVLAEASDYWDEEREDWSLPDQIEGEDVVRVEDDYVVGGGPFKRLLR